MTLAYKEDWEDARERIEAWYRCEVVGRCAVRIRAQRKPAPPATPPPPDTLEKHWTDIDAVLDRHERAQQNLWHGGEALPTFMPNLGPGIVSAWLGCPLRFAEATTWTEPIIESWENFGGLKFDEENRWWQWMKRATKAAARRGKGKFITCVADLHGGGDCLAALRGTEKLCLDLLEHSDKIKECERFIRSVWFKVSEDLYSLATSEGQDGSGGFLGWGPGRTWPLQEDIFALISPAMSREFFLEGIAEQARGLDRAIFHLDGPEALPHLDALLEISDLDGIQWQPGHAHREMTQWISLIKKIQSKGKCVLIAARASQIEPILAEVSARGLMISTTCASVEEGQALLKKVETWTRD